MNKNKLFEKWVESNFSGLSPYTLIQLLVSNLDKFLFSDVLEMYVTEIKNMIYIDLFRYFTGIKNDITIAAFNCCKSAVENCEWL